MEEKDKQYRIRLDKELVNKSTENINLTLLINNLLLEYTKNKNLRSKIFKKINNNNITY